MPFWYLKGAFVRDKRFSLFYRFTPNAAKCSLLEYYFLLGHITLFPVDLSGYGWSDKRSIGIENPWTFDEVKESLLYLFLRPDRIERTKKLRGKNTVFEQKINKKLRAALVLIKRYKDDEKKKLAGKARVGLRFRNEKWKIVEFQDFYPLNAFEILTGGL